MRAAIWTVLLTAFLVGCGSAASAPVSPASTTAAQTSLTISFWASQETKVPKRWTLRCRPAGGTHPTAPAACTRLYALAAPFAPVPDTAVCTQVYGGPQRAVVTGTHRGRRVWARLSLTNGCHIARFSRVAFLVPGFTVGAGPAGSGSGG